MEPITYWWNILNVQAIWRIGSVVFEQKRLFRKSLLHKEVHKLWRGWLAPKYELNCRFLAFFNHTFKLLANYYIALKHPIMTLIFNTSFLFISDSRRIKRICRSRWWYQSSNSMGIELYVISCYIQSKWRSCKFS